MSRDDRYGRSDREGRPSKLDALVRQAAGLFVRLLARFGCAPDDIQTAVQEACREVPKSWARTAQVSVPEMDAAAHALTLWFSEPAYFDSSGNPKALPLRGPAPSLESLSLRAAPKLEVEKVLRHLLRPSVLRCEGDCYVPRDRVLSFRGTGQSHSLNLRTLTAILSTLEHNAPPGTTTPGWFERCAVNLWVPLSQVQGFDQRLRQRGHSFLVETDTDLLGCERAGHPTEPTVCIGVGIYRFQEEPLPPEGPAGRPSRRPK